MTNKISKAREALERVASDARSYVGSFSSLEEYKQREADIITVKNLFGTLSSIDAERLGESIEWADVTAWVALLDHEDAAVNERFKERLKTVLEAAATLHGLVRGE